MQTNTKTKRYINDRKQKRRLNNDSYLRATDTYQCTHTNVEQKPRTSNYFHRLIRLRTVLYKFHYFSVSFHPQSTMIGSHDEHTSQKDNRATIITETR